MSHNKPIPAQDVLTVADIQLHEVIHLLRGYQLELRLLDDQQIVTGSYWGDSEAGLVKNRVYVRRDTPIHSLLHEACHFICMDHERRSQLDTDAAGDYDEENAVCYLQILLSDQLRQMGQDRMMRDMDHWGYSFRLGSTRAWFEQDAEDARSWLITQGLINPDSKTTGFLRR